MLHLRFILSISALLFGILVVFISLVSTNQVISFEGEQASNLKFYVGEKILPDHVIYPLVAGADRLILIAAPTQEKIKLQLAYSQIRMDYAQALLLKNELVLATNALTKSQKYISLAALQVLDTGFANEELRQEVFEQLKVNIAQAQALLEQLPADRCCLAQQLNINNQALLERFPD